VSETPNIPFLVCCTQTIVDEIAIKEIRQKDVALSCALAILSAAHGVDDQNWGIINRAILSRWKMCGLERIKKRALDIVSGKIAPDAY
jgi:hypothetical protein